MTDSPPSPTRALTAADARSRLEAVEARLSDACRAAGRPRDHVTLLAVSKRHPDTAVEAFMALGVRDFGENVVQAWRRRLEAFPGPRLGAPASSAAGSAPRWHLIGPLQTNKAKHVARGRPALLHTIDRVPLVDALERSLARVEAPPLDVLIQVNVDGEPQKAGVAPNGLAALADAVAAAPHLALRGLMCIPKASRLPGADPRRAFGRCRELSRTIADRLAGETARPVLSMGMSGDLEHAIAEGATIVRVGTALFGRRLEA